MSRGRPSVREIKESLSTASFEDVENMCRQLASDDRKEVRKAIQIALRKHERLAEERKRVESMYAFQREVAGSGIVLGLDEVGRGPLAGPLTVAAVALPYVSYIWGINDSKKLTAQKRTELAEEIKRKALAYGICHVWPEDIDRMGIVEALRTAMKGAIDNAQIQTDAIVIDGNPIHIHHNEICIVKGDGKVASIAAASILAKVTRDSMMVEYDKHYPEYHFAENKGYGSQGHMAAIRNYGLTPLHRKSFCRNI